MSAVEHLNSCTLGLSPKPFISSPSQSCLRSKWSSVTDNLWRAGSSAQAFPRIFTHAVSVTVAPLEPIKSQQTAPAKGLLRLFSLPPLTPDLQQEGFLPPKILFITHSMKYVSDCFALLCPNNMPALVLPRYFFYQEKSWVWKEILISSLAEHFTICVLIKLRESNYLLVNASAQEN